MEKTGQYCLAIPINDDLPGKLEMTEQYCLAIPINDHLPGKLEMTGQYCLPTLINDHLPGKLEITGCAFSSMVTVMVAESDDPYKSLQVTATV